MTFYCSSGQEGENGLLNVVRSGEQEEVDLVYFWRTVEIQQDLLPDSEKDSGSRNLDSSLFTHLFGTACFDPTFSVSGDVEAQYMCENLCLSNPVCGAYTYDLDEKECAMRQTCNTQVVSLVASSGIRKPGSAPSPAATSDSSQGGSDILPEGDHFVYLLRTACTGDSLAAVAADSAGACERSCSGRSSCGAFSFNFDSRMCYLKTGCAQTEAKDNNISARRTPGPANGRSYTYLPGVGCKDPTTTVHRSTTAQQCQSLCSSDPGCAAFSANLKDCFLKSGCSQQEREPGDLSGIKAPA